MIPVNHRLPPRAKAIDYNRILSNIDYDEIVDRVLDRMNRVREVDLTCDTVQDDSFTNYFTPSQWQKKKAECMSCSDLLDDTGKMLDLDDVGKKVGCGFTCPEFIRTAIANRMSQCKSSLAFEEKVRTAITSPCDFISDEAFGQDLLSCGTQECASAKKSIASAELLSSCSSGREPVSLQRAARATDKEVLGQQINGERCIDVYDSERRELCSEKVCATKCAREAWMIADFPFPEGTLVHDQFRQQWDNKRELCENSLKVPAKWDEMQYKYECNTDRTPDRANAMYEIKSFDPAMPYQDSLCTVFRGCDKMKNEGDCNRKNGCAWARGTCSANRIMPCSDENLRSLSCEANCTKPNYRCLRQEERNILGMKEENCQ